MTWFKVDDGWADHPKVRDAGLPGRALWMAAGARCSRLSTDGLVTARTAGDAAYLAEVDLVTASGLLVVCGLWHDQRALRKCDRCLDAVSRLDCSRLAAGDHYFHDWLDYQPTRDEAKVPEHRWKAARLKRLSRNRDLLEAIDERDLFHCRYCGERVDFLDKVSDLGGTRDHVDPDARSGPRRDGNTLENVVTACRGCNRRKSQRTPEEAGMVLLAAPGPVLSRDRTGLAGASTGPVREPSLASAHETDPDRDGSGQAGHQPASVPGQNEDRRDLA